MIILASVAISAVSKSGVFDTTKDVADLYNQTVAEESNYIKKIINNLEGYSTGELGNILVDPVEAIPIYTKEQLLKIGSGEEVQIDGKTYVYSLNSTYRLMNDITLDYNGVWHLPSNVILSGGDHQVKIKDTSKGTEIYYYYNKASNYKFATTQEGYIYDGLTLHYEATNNTGDGFSNIATSWKDLTGNNNDGTLVNINMDSTSGWTTNSLKLDGINDYVRMVELNYDYSTIENVVKLINIVDEKFQVFLNNIESGGQSLMVSDDGRIVAQKYILGGYKRIYSDVTVGTNEIYSISGGNDGTRFYLRENENMYSVNQEGIVTPPKNNTVFGIGVNMNGTNAGIPATDAYANAEIYSIRIYNRCLTDGEIAQNYKIDKERYIDPQPLTGNINMTGYNNWPDGFAKGLLAFAEGAYDSNTKDIWMVPYSADRVIKFNTITGNMTGYNNWPEGFTKKSGAFLGALDDGKNIWMIPFLADKVIKVNKETGEMTGYDNWPSGFVKDGSAQKCFVGGELVGTDIWMVPYGDKLIKIDTTKVDSLTEEYMKSYDGWPDGFEAGGLYAFGGSVYDGHHIWLIPNTANMVVRVDPKDGSMKGYNNWPTGYIKVADKGFYGKGVFDGTNIWMIPRTTDRVIKLNVKTGEMTGYTDFPNGFIGGTDMFSGATYDGKTIWMGPLTANMVVGIDSKTGEMKGYNNWPEGFINKRFWGIVYDRKNVWLIPYDADRIIKISGE